jgi:hypothetical protein
MIMNKELDNAINWFEIPVADLKRLRERHPAPTTPRGDRADRLLFTVQRGSRCGNLRGGHERPAQRDRCRQGVRVDRIANQQDCESENESNARGKA